MDHAIKRIDPPKPYLLKIGSSNITICTRPNYPPLHTEEKAANARLFPIIKWAGGKQWLSVIAKQLTPKNWKGKYYEPFLGGGSFFFSLQPKSAILADKNKDLISMYRTVRDNVEKVISLLSTYPYNKEFFYAIRSQDPKSPIDSAARFLYLNRSCWNGLYRVNKNGKFNTPFGKFKNPTICYPDRLREASLILKKSTLKFCDFEKCIANAVPGDFVYFDPPYVTGHENNGFLKYNIRLFSWADQERLAQTSIRLAKSGVYVLVSNANYPAVVKLYKDFYYFRTRRNNLIGGKGSSRGLTGEALLSNYPLLDCEPEVING